MHPCQQRPAPRPRRGPCPQPSPATGLASPRLAAPRGASLAAPRGASLPTGPGGPHSRTFFFKKTVQKLRRFRCSGSAKVQNASQFRPRGSRGSTVHSSRFKASGFQIQAVRMFKDQGSNVPGSTINVKRFSVERFRGSSFKGPRVQSSSVEEVKRFTRSEVQRFTEDQRFNGSGFQTFPSSAVQRLRGPRSLSIRRFRFKSLKGSTFKSEVQQTQETQETQEVQDVQRFKMLERLKGFTKLKRLKGSRFKVSRSRFEVQGELSKNNFKAQGGVVQCSRFGVRGSALLFSPSLVEHV